MQFQIENNPEGYVVSWYDGEHWRPLRNFGEYEGHALTFRLYDCPKLDLWQLEALAKAYDKTKIYSRISATRFVVRERLEK